MSLRAAFQAEQYRYRREQYEQTAAEMTAEYAVPQVLTPAVPALWDGDGKHTLLRSYGTGRRCPPGCLFWAVPCGDRWYTVLNLVPQCHLCPCQQRM